MTTEPPDHSEPPPSLLPRALVAESPDTLQSVATTGGFDSPPISAATVRDRIVVLGRTQSGKTIYLSSMYCRLWKDPSDIAIKALDGRTHKTCVDVFQTLRDGRWPASTVGSRYLDFELSWEGQARPLISLDYPGEVFRKAFIENSESTDVQELLDHIDRAAGVIALLDPGVVTGKDMRVSMDDDFGMLKALERIRQWPGGDQVPVAIVLTKYDQRAGLIKADGGPVSFVKRRYPTLVTDNQRARVFVCSAVQQVPGPNGPVINPHFRPTGVVAPLRYLLKRLNEQDKRIADAHRLEQANTYYSTVIGQARRRRHRTIWYWTLGWVGFFLLMALAGLVAWMAGKL